MPIKHGHSFYKHYLTHKIEEQGTPIELRKIRIKIEHAIGYLKVYQPFVQTCGFLTNRKRLQQK